MIIRGEKYLPVGTFLTPFQLKKQVYSLMWGEKWLFAGCCQRNELPIWG